MESRKTGKGGASIGGGVAWGFLVTNLEPCKLKGSPESFQYTLGGSSPGLSFWNSKPETFAGSFVVGGEIVAAAAGGVQGDF